MEDKSNYPNLFPCIHEKSVRIQTPAGSSFFASAAQKQPPPAARSAPHRQHSRNRWKTARTYCACPYPARHRSTRHNRRRKPDAPGSRCGRFPRWHRARNHPPYETGAHYTCPRKCSMQRRRHTTPKAKSRHRAQSVSSGCHCCRYSPEAIPASRQHTTRMHCGNPKQKQNNCTAKMRPQTGVFCSAAGSAASGLPPSAHREQCRKLSDFDSSLCLDSGYAGHHWRAASRHC